MIIDIDDWNKRKRLSKIKFNFALIHNNFCATYFSPNDKYVITFEFGDESKFNSKMTAEELYNESYRNFKIQKIY